MTTTQNSEETWAPVAGFPLYEVSNAGRVRNLIRQTPKIIALGTHRGGYKLAMMRKSSEVFVRYVHRLVATAFLPNPFDMPVVHHKDANPANNRVENLEWTTQRDNIHQAMKVRGNWLLKAPRRTTKIVRVNLDGSSPVSFNSIADASRALNHETVLAGGVARAPDYFSPNICHAIKNGTTSCGFRWYTARKWRAINASRQK